MASGLARQGGDRTPPAPAHGQELPTQLRQQTTPADVSAPQAANAQQLHQAVVRQVFASLDVDQLVQTVIDADWIGELVDHWYSQC